MKGIVLYISLLLLVVGCGRDNDVERTSSCSVAHLWSYVGRSTVIIPDDIYVEGYVVANDKLGELNKCVVVADSSGGVAINIDADDVENILPLYSRVRVHCSGLWIANNGTKLLLGTKPTGEYLVDRVPSSLILNYIHPQPSDNLPPIVNQRTIATLQDRDMLTMVSIDGLSLVEEEHGAMWTDIDPNSGRTVDTQRHFTDGCDTLLVVVEASCHYAKESIPVKPLRLSGIVDRYAGEMVFRVVNHGVNIN